MTEHLPLHGANGVAPLHLCSFEGCARVGSAFPVIQFGTADRVPGGKCPYRLEVPKAVCPQHQKDFRPGVYLGDASQAKIDAMLEQHGKPLGDYKRLFLTWKPLSDPAWVELKDGGQARLWF